MHLHILAGDLDVAYLESGDPDGPAVLLLHGFPYDVHAYRSGPVRSQPFALHLSKGSPERG
ncbi:hypothetical protein [Hydrogenophaga sp.]|uniref:hypothetical protein n=1 Tax=Hydrogenophaga sp. TaxID=1904254 RepID=UPI0035613178